MKIIVDSNIPYLRGLPEPYGSVEYIEGEKITSSVVKDADALLVRTRTRCDRTLLEGSSVKFIGTATIGTDHIDTGWCDKNGIRWVSAPGCNSGAVMQYVASAILHLASKNRFETAGTTLGIIGAGNVGMKVKKMAMVLGMNVLVNDPPRERNEGSTGFISLGELAEKADIISFHVPLTYDGIDPTFKLGGIDFFNKIKKGSYIINTSRGGVIDEQVLTGKIDSDNIAGTVIDVWENEPVINSGLLDLADITTPHIAGYSQDGKWNASRIIYEKFLDFFGLDRVGNIQEKLQPVLNDLINLDDVTGSEAGFRKAIHSTYDIISDSRRLKESPTDFELLRNNYPARREFHAYRVTGPDEIVTGLKNIGFR